MDLKSETAVEIIFSPLSIYPLGLLGLENRMAPEKTTWFYRDLKLKIFKDIFHKIIIALVKKT